MSFDDSGSSSSQTLLPSVQRSPENQSEECNRPDAGSEPHVHSTPKEKPTLSLQTQSMGN